MGKRNIKTLKTPFMWSGSKDRRWKNIEPYFNLNSNSIYCEPFVGGGSIYFRLLVKYGPIFANISDVNKELINCYYHLKFNYDWISNNLPSEKDKNIFNEWKIEDLTSGKESAMKFLYLNRNRFFGLGGWMNADRYARDSVVYRVNHFGRLMVNTNIFNDCFDVPIANNSIVFCDPPYPESKNNSCYKINENNVLKLNLDYLNFINQQNCKFLFITKKINKIEDFCKSNNISYDIVDWNFRKPQKNVQKDQEIWIKKH